MAYASTPKPDGRWLLVATNGSDRHRLYVVDLQTVKIFHSFDLPGNPLELLVRPGRRCGLCELRPGGEDSDARSAFVADGGAY